MLQIRLKGLILTRSIRPLVKQSHISFIETVIVLESYLVFVYIAFEHNSSNSARNCTNSHCVLI